MCKSTFLNLANSRQNFTENPLTVWRCLTSTPTIHSAVKKEPSIHKRSDTTWSYLKTTFFILTRIFLACPYPLHLTIKNIKKALIDTHSNLLSQQTLHTETNILPIIAPFSDIGESFIAIIHKTCHIITNDATFFAIYLFETLSAFLEYSSIQNHLVHRTNIWLLSTPYLTQLLTLHLHTPKHTSKHTQSSYIIIILPPLTI